MDGPASLKIPAGTQPGKVLRLRGKGVPHLRGNGRGDQLVIVNVEIPTASEQRAARALREAGQEPGQRGAPARAQLSGLAERHLGGIAAECFSLIEHQTWLEVSLLLDGELAEAVAEVLAATPRRGSDREHGRASRCRMTKAMPSVRCACAATCRSTPAWKRPAAGWRRGCGTWGASARCQPPSIAPVQEADWAEAWKEHYHPILIGERLVIVPAWLESPDPERIPCAWTRGWPSAPARTPPPSSAWSWSNPVMAELVPQETDVIDVGCGSGILSMAALKLGARRAIAVDIDPQAVSVTQENAALNGVSAGLEVGTGSLAEVRDGVFSIRQAQVVLANILALVIVQLLEAGFADLLAPGGAAIFSGILAEQEPQVIATLEKCGLSLSGRRQSGDWVALQVSRH